MDPQGLRSWGLLVDGCRLDHQEEAVTVVVPEVHKGGLGHLLEGRYTVEVGVGFTDHG